ncbi:MAG TPA: D-TA family PLP-dependent enzyme [Verrucomicrobiota bacterium]|nr:D-TA family PLP-dependent enzyme [Verrucomicrobiota bacterium]
MSDWFRISNEADVPSPALLIFPDRVEENLRRMIRLAGGPERLRPHVKTHKLPQIVELELKHGITRFKAATIAEAEMCADARAMDVLLAYPLVGPNARRFADLIRAFPDTRFLTLVDNPASVGELAAAARSTGVTFEVLVDLNVGMNRTGVEPGDAAVEVYRAVASAPGLVPGGLHAYDGHLHYADHDRLAAEAAASFKPVWELRDRLIAAGLKVPRIVASGTPTFQLLASTPGVEVGAGTTVLWDFGQAETCPDLDFLEAAVLLTRVVSRPTANRLTLDLGHKAVASEMPPPRVKLFGLEDAIFAMHSEEHLVLETPRAAEFPVGTVVYGIPRHVCPTVALHSEVFVVREGRVTETWPVVARARRITI